MTIVNRNCEGLIRGITGRICGSNCDDIVIACITISSRFIISEEICSFNFLRADALREGGAPPLAAMCYQQIVDLDASLMTTIEIRMDAVLQHAHVDELLVISHRWEGKVAPASAARRKRSCCSVMNLSGPRRRSRSCM